MVFLFSKPKNLEKTKISKTTASRLHGFEFLDFWNVLNGKFFKKVLFAYYSVFISPSYANNSHTHTHTRSLNCIFVRFFGVFFGDDVQVVLHTHTHVFSLFTGFLTYD